MRLNRTGDPADAKNGAQLVTWGIISTVLVLAGLAGWLRSR